jgi:predicted RNA-binding protein with TRAM domain
MKIRTTLILGLTAIAVIGTSALQTVNMKWTPKVGATYKFSMKANMVLAGMGEASVTGKISQVVEKVDGDQVTVKIQQTDSKVNFGGQEMEQPNSVVTEKRTLNGEVLEAKIEPEPQMSLARMEAAIAFHYPTKPVAIGDSWVYAAAGKLPGTVPAEATFKYEGDEEMSGTKCYKVSYTYKESGDNKVTGSGTVWLSIADSEMVKAVQSVKNCPLEGLGNFDMESTTVREK